MGAGIRQPLASKINLFKDEVCPLSALIYAKDYKDGAMPRLLHIGLQS
jgi:hypothetical protein